MADEKNVEELKVEQDDLLKKLDDSGYDWNKHPHVLGIIKDNQSERKSRQDADSEIERLRGVNVTLTEELAAKPEPKKDNELDENAYLTVGEAKKLLAQASEEKKSEDTKKQQADLQIKFSKSEATAKVEFTTEKMGEGLDYSSVLKGYGRMVQKNPAYHQVMLSAENPSKQAYEIGLLDPEIAKLVEASKNVKLLDKMKGSDIPKGGGAGGLNIDDKNYEQLLNMPMPDLMKSLKAEEDAAVK